VRRTPQGDVSVPLTVAYNHHFESTMIGNGARLERIVVSGPDDPVLATLGMQSGDMGHRRANESEVWVVVTNPEREARLPAGSASSQDFGAANGGEFRKSFHGCVASRACVRALRACVCSK
jgi:hypothetical protein